MPRVSNSACLISCSRLGNGFGTKKRNITIMMVFWILDSSTSRTNTITGCNITRCIEEVWNGGKSRGIFWTEIEHSVHYLRSTSRWSLELKLCIFGVLVNTLKPQSFSSLDFIRCFCCYKENPINLYPWNPPCFKRINNKGGLVWSGGTHNNFPTFFFACGGQKSQSQKDQ